MDDKTKNEDLRKTLEKLFHGKNIMERVAAANHLGYLKNPNAIDSLGKALKTEKNEIVINRIIEALGEIRDKNATSLIIDILKEELKLPEEGQDKQRIFLIIESLMKIGDKNALNDLGILLNSCDNDIRQLTIQAFECIDPNWKGNIKNLKT
jgi:HEAT repeat protein